MKPILALRHVPHEGLGILEDIFRDAGLVYSFVDLFHDAPRTFRPEQLAGLVVLGGPMNVDETQRYPFLAAEVDWLKQAVAEQLPVLGVCLGSQLLAKSLGAEVRANGVKEIGWYPLELLPATDEDPLFCGLPRTPTVFQWHGDTFDLPEGAVQLARSAACEQQAFRFGPSAYGLQFHVEVTGPMIEDWMREPGGCAELGALDYVDPAEIRGRAPTELPAMHRLGKQVFRRFANLCHRRAS
jgi:GMP synthase (glutamine-hydrolysing)